MKAFLHLRAATRPIHYATKAGTTGSVLGLSDNITALLQQKYHDLTLCVSFDTAKLVKLQSGMHHNACLTNSVFHPFFSAWDALRDPTEGHINFFLFLERLEGF